MRPRFAWLGVCMAGLAACASAPAAVPAATPSLAAAQANLRVVGNRIFLPVDVQGIATEALLDSGAEMTLLDTAFAATAGLAAFGEEEARGTGAGTQSVQFAEGVTLKAAGKTLQDRMVAILDLTDISQRVVGAPLTVVLGREFFDAGIYAMDIEAGRIEETGAEALPASDPLSLQDAHGIKQLGAAINGVPVLADFDLGNGNEVLLSRAFAERAGLLAPDNILGTKMGGGIGGDVERTLVRIETLEIGGLTLKDVTAAVSPHEKGADANVGVSVLRHFRIVVDYEGNRIWLEPRA
ncbi:putative lipoprotein [Hyphomonas polymorpha PS728]|uniref:Putative lipoprotein n=1 Tax=Hyphomonas polymorpha PS728 TaxID=1280954 RepID=A0A062VK09_9PROT|nr:retropepsin-like aspartic protease [Hyphomonas polymorpha]KCZ98417.1 putative lipoprotein [Hyphomonas polymorpha PS728]